MITEWRGGDREILVNGTHETEFRVLRSPTEFGNEFNLLFGVLALQAAFIDNNQFAEVCAAWTTRKHSPLAELLRERGWITGQE